MNELNLSFPLGFEDISLWLAVTSIILVVTSELLSPHHGRTNLVIEGKNLRKTALTLGILFLSTVAIRIYLMIISL
jgi:hypothetical protein